MNEFTPALLTSSRRSENCPVRGFTLVELLVVVAVLGILAALSFPVFSAVQNRARVSQTKTQFTQYITAMEGYRSTYGYYPTFRFVTEMSGSLSGDHHVRLNEFPNRREIFSVSLTGRMLNGDPVANGGFFDQSGANPQRHQFFDFSEKEFNESGQIVDAFGNPDIRIVIDTDYNGQISADALDGLDLDQDFIRTGVAIYSVGDPNAGFPEIRSW
ncbi:MAG: prepilin-type N-terminal cleavage/methylation domain-containing protein [Opitutales bacterium]|nr:prepilin-type N-terminal cleavage/methylation domain-containing protein [Opitutales bacterium]MCH8541025.1 prepilin-type N-terminal cleavage/methylation domain-containing protein [Opitutales bacterium]